MQPRALFQLTGERRYAAYAQIAYLHGRDPFGRSFEFLRTHWRCSR